MSMRTCSWALFSIIGMSLFAQGADDVSATLAEKLKTGKLTEAEAFLIKEIATSPKNQQARFGLGVVKVLAAIEQLGQSQYRFGALNDIARNVPVLRLPVPHNPRPQEVTYEQVRKTFLDFQTKLVQAEQELAAIDLGQEIKLPIDLSEIKLDLNGDGKAGDDETFLQIFGVVNRRRPGEPAQEMRVVFDTGDVPWLRGYCHFVAGFCDLVLAYDHQRLFDHCGQLIYPRHKPSVEVSNKLDEDDGLKDAQLLDAIAAIHLLNFPVKEAQRMESARKHFLEMIRTSRQSWELILKETDDDNEWLPNPKQTGILRLPITQELIDGWHGVLKEMEDLLEGRKLIPFWRDYFRFMNPRSKEVPEQGRGINLKKFFQEPRDFDLILTIQGSSVLPYLEQGPLSHPVTWNELTAVFQGQFLGFAVWFN